MHGKEVLLRSDHIISSDVSYLMYGRLRLGRRTLLESC